MDPIILTCGRVRQSFDVPADRAGETCYFPYCGDLHRIPKLWTLRRRRKGSPAKANAKASQTTKLQPNRQSRPARPDRLQYALAASCGFFIGVLLATGASEFDQRPSASVLYLEMLLQRAREEKQQAEQARAAVESELTAAHIERRQIERERNEAQRRLRHLHADLDEAVRRSQALRQ
jgi:hypothetical protein